MDAFNAFKNMYQHHLIEIGALRQAVIDGMITEDNFKKITGVDYE